MNQILVNQKLIITPEFKRKKKLYKFNFFLSVFLLCTLFSYYIYAEYDRNKSEQISQQILLGLQEKDDTIEEETIEEESSVTVENGVLYVTLLPKTSEEKNVIDITKILQQYRKKEAEENEGQKKNKDVKIVESVADDGTRYYSEAILKIEKLGIEYPVLSDVSEALLKISLNKFYGPNPNEVGNYCIAGHNYKSGKMFGKLKYIEIGDRFVLEDLYGRAVTYEVYDRYLVEPTDTSCTTQRTAGKREVTLITCQNNGKQRLVVRAKEVK